MGDFKIFNYYPTKPIKLTSGKWSKKIGYGSIETVPAKKAAELFAPGSFVEIFLSSAGGERATRVSGSPERGGAAHDDYVFLTKYKINHPVSEIHIGQITTRFSGGTWDDQMVVASNAVQGRPYIRIHNPTMIPLRLNNNILVEPNSVLFYTGRHHFGVPLGLVLKDVDGLYPRLQLTKPITDIYYGIVSDTPQPIYGGWQKVWTTDIDYSNYYDAYGHVISL